MRDLKECEGIKQTFFALASSFGELVQGNLRPNLNPCVEIKPTTIIADRRPPIFSPGFRYAYARL